MSEEKTPFEKRQDQFGDASSLDEATKIVWRRPTDGPGMYQHYTTLDRVLDKIITKRWYLTRCDSKKLNDLREAEKYGRSRKELMRRTYIMCFGNGFGENVAMWGLYARDDSLAIRISIPRKTIKKWMSSLLHGEDPDVRDQHGRKIARSRLVSAVFHEMVYVAVQNKEIRDDFDIRRANTISWEGARCNFGDGDYLENEVQKEKYAGWLKDYEWHHERESRLCVRMKKAISGKAVSIAIPDYVIADMRFTFSPWLEHDETLNAIKTAVEAALKSTSVKVDKRMQRFRRSVLQGALNFPS